MFIIEATRRVSRAAVERIREAFIEFDHIAFKDVDVAAEDAYTVIREGKGWVIAFEDPSFIEVLSDPEPILADCGS